KYSNFVKYRPVTRPIITIQQVFNDSGSYTKTSTTTVMTIARIMFKTIPSRTISLTRTRLDANTIEFGGVATGRQNAQLQAIAAGIISNSIGSCSACAIAAMIGINNVAVAVFDITSVRSEMLSVSKNNINH